ncbi:MAG TPA: glycosyltransferase family 1 protein [Patescibacteria group bacterium]
MRIGIDIRLIGKKRTGDEAVFFNLVKNLAKLDSENEYLLFTDTTDRETLKEIGNSLGISQKTNFKIMALDSPNRFAWNFWTLPHYLRANPVDIYHTQYITPWFVSKKIKIVTIIHDISFNFFPQFIKKKDLFFLKTLIPLSLARADAIIAVSQFTKDEIVRYYRIDPEKVTVVHNAVESNLMDGATPGQNERDRIRDKYALPEKFILYIGTLQPRKNIPHLIEAFARISEKIDDLKLVICGNPKAHNFDKRIDAALEKHPLAGKVQFPGFVAEEDKAVIFSLAHVFAFPTLYEGFGIPVLEAMAQGLPVTCSDIPSLKEVAADSVLYFDSSSLEDFSEKLYSISMDNDLRSRLILKGKERVSFFSWEKSAQKYLALYSKLFHN